MLKKPYQWLRMVLLPDLIQQYLRRLESEEMNTILLMLLKQVDSDIKMSVRKQFAEHKR